MTNQKYQAGEQPYSGTKLIELPDLSAMMAEIKVNEVDVSKVLPGMDVTIITDAYSDLRYEGKVVSIANLAQNKDSNSKIKVFPVVISIQGTSDKLMPGLSASCKIKVREVPDVLYIPIDALFRDQGLEFVYVKTNTGYRRQDVKTGMSNTDYVVITEGLKGDEELALMNPFIEKKNGSGKTAAISPKQ
jgi:multidrug efflux pump subunit AcrA (membrane-fusion protein)